MALKFLQMGYTRERRYANNSILNERWKQAEAEPRYAARKDGWKARYG
jgi:hypothetical protein